MLGPYADRPLAKPPAGSGLKPVMGSPGLPVMGHTLTHLRDPIRAARRRYARYGPVSWGNAFGVTMVSGLSPDAAQQVLVNRDKAFANGPGWRHFIGPFFHRGLMLLDFEEHRHHRRIMQSAFTPDRLRSYLDGMNDAFAEGYANWRPGSGFRFHTAFKQLTLDLATTVFMGHHLGDEASRVNQAFFDTVQAGTAPVRLPIPGTRWKAGLDGRVVLEEFLREQLPAKRDGDGDDLFTALCHAETEDGEHFTDDDVVNHMIFLLMAAHDTSTTTMTTLVHELARHPEWQDRLREESRALGHAELSYDDLAELPSHAMAIKEAQRLIAPLPSMARYAVTDTELLGHYVPAGTHVGLYPYLIHHLEELWTFPESFDPDRFGPERREDKIHPYAWMPFGGGVHKCIGMHFGNLEITTALHHLLRNFSWSVPDGYEMPVDLTTLPYPPDGLPIELSTLDRMAGRPGLGARTRS